MKENYYGKELTCYGGIYGDSYDEYESKIALILGLKLNCLDCFLNRSPSSIDDIFETMNDMIWDSHENDLKDISRIFPEVIIRFSYDTEMEENKWYTWTKYFKDGKMAVYEGEKDLNLDDLS